MGRGKSTGRSKKSKEVVSANALESNAASVDVESSVVGPSPPRARVTVDDTDDVEEVQDAGDDGYSSAVEKMGAAAAASAVAEEKEVTVGEDGSEKDVEADEAAGNGDGPSLDEEPSSSSSSSTSVDEESSSSTPDAEEDEFSIRAKLTTESDEHEEEDVEENDEEPKTKELDVEEEFDEANDEVLGEEEDAPSTAVGGSDEEAALPRIIARESVSTDDDAAMTEDSNTSSAVEEEVDQAASAPLPDQEEESVVADAAETREFKAPSPVEEEVDQAASTPLPNQEEEESVVADAAETREFKEASPVAEEETGAEDISAVVPFSEAEVGEALKEEDSLNVEEKSFEPATEPEASSPVAEEETGAEDISAVVPLAEAEVGEPLKEEDSLNVEEKSFEPATEPEASSPVAEEETGAEDISAVVPLAEAEVGEPLKEEDSLNVEEKTVEPATKAAVVEEKQDEEETVLQTEAAVVEEEQEEKVTVPQTIKAEQSPAEETQLLQAVTSAAEPAFDDVAGVKEEAAPEVKPLATAEVGNFSKESEVAEAEQAVIPPGLGVESRGASSSLLEELRKLSESRSLREESSVSEEVKPAVVAESEPEEEKSLEKADESTVTKSKYVVERAASNDLLAELEKLADARKEASEKAASGSSEAIVQSTEKEEGSSAPQELVVDQKVVDVGESVSEKSLDELKELTYDFHMYGRSESDVPKVQSALAASPESAEQTSTDSSSSASAVAEKLSPEVAEVRIMEEATVEESDSATAKEDLFKDDLSKEAADDSGAVPSPAKLYTALKAVDDDLPALKSENGNAETENVQSKSRGFSAVDFTGDDGDSDADAEDEDEENEDDDDEDDDDEDDTDMDTAKALAELANAVGKSGNGSDSGNKPSMGAAGPSLPSLPQRPAVRKTAAASALDTAGRISTRPTAAPSTQLTTTNDENANGESAEGNETREKLQNIRVKFLRLAHRLGQSPQNVVVAQVLYRLGLAESLRGGSAPNRTGAFSFDRANALAEEQEAANQEEELDFACTILVLGKTGVGKSATINSIFDDQKSVTSAFKPSTTKVQEIVGTVHGIKVRVIDTPGLLPSVADQQHNERIMGQVKKHIKKQSPDIVLYFDRLDMQSRDYGDLPLLRTITDLFGAAVWFNAIVVLTHASSAPPDGPNGVPLSYEMFVAQRSHVVQQTIRQAAGDMRLMNPVSLVENHPACRTNRNGQRVLPNGQIWKPQLLLLCFASKILAEANSLLKLQETATPGRPFGQRSRVPPLPFLLSSLLQSRAQLKLPDEQVGESDESDDDEEEDDSDADDYDELPPFRPLSKEELEELSKEQRQDYMDELADRERLFQKKQYREEMRRRKEMKKRAAQMSKEELAQPDEADDEAGKAAAVPVPMPDMALPPSFDSDNPTHRYRYLETANQWLVRPVLETHGWDHDAGYDGFNVEKMFVVKDKIPASISGQVTKDKKEAQVSFEAAASVKHGEGKVTLTGFDIQTIGKDLAYTLRAETRFNNFRRNKTTAGLTCTVLNDTIAAGVKLEDRILIGKRIKMVVNGGVLTGKGDKAFGGSLEATLRGKEYPLSRTLSTLGLSVMDWHGDLAIGGNLQSQFMVGKTMLVGRANLNNRGSGQVSIRASSSEQLQMVLIGIVPILRSLINCRFGFGQPSQ